MSDRQPLHVEFCGEWYEVAPDATFVVGRTGDLDIDDNPFLHRKFLSFAVRNDLWTVANIGDRLGATIADVDGSVSAYLGSGAVLPLVLPRATVRFGAGPTTYELLLVVDDAPFTGAVPPARGTDGTVTLGSVVLTRSQRQCIVALAEHALRRGGTGASQLPLSREAADRLGWSLTKFNRKLDNVCDKLSKAGVKGLHGSADSLASNRRARLVEYSLSARLITPEDVALLP